MKLYSNLFLLALTVFSFIILSCKKDKECIARITITSDQSDAIAGATVRLYYTDTSSTGTVGNVDETKLTDANGEAEFTFELEAILFIEASKDTLSGTGIVRLTPGETVDETVVIK